MKERIKKLIEESGMTLVPRRVYDQEKYPDLLEGDRDYFENNLQATREFFDNGLEKFAELIIKECSQVCLARAAQPQSNHLINDEATFCSIRINQHFGIK